LNRIRRLATGGFIHQAWFWSLIRIYRIAHCNLHTYNRFIQSSVCIITVNLLHQTYKFNLLHHLLSIVYFRWSSRLYSS
jgi:hypothetical protein